MDARPGAEGGVQGLYPVYALDEFERNRVATIAAVENADIAGR